MKSYGKTDEVFFVCVYVCNIEMGWNMRQRKCFDVIWFVLLNLG
jgi:hypothetical protein